MSSQIRRGSGHGQDALFPVPDSEVERLQELNKKIERERVFDKAYSWAVGQVRDRERLGPTATIPARSALQRLLDLQLNDEPQELELDSRFVELVIRTMDAEGIKQSLESYFTNMVSSDRVATGYRFTAEWPDRIPDHSQCPTVTARRLDAY